MDKRSYFGVKSINGFYDVKEIRLPEDASRVSEFDFILEDTQRETRQSESKGYVSGSIKVMTEFNKPAIINGWKLTGIIIYGRWPKLSLYDKFGKFYQYARDGFGQNDYDDNKPRYIHDILVEALDFTNKYLFAKHRQLYSNFQYNLPNYDNGISISQLSSLMEQIKNYTDDYQEIISLLKKEDAPQEMIDQLNSAYNDAITKYFKFGIII